MIEFTLGDEMRGLRVTLTQDGGAGPLDLTGAAVSLIAASSDITATLDVTGTVVDAGDGVCHFAAIGDALPEPDMGPRRRVVFRAQVRVVAASTAVGYSRVFQVAIERPVVAL